MSILRTTLYSGTGAALAAMSALALLSRREGRSGALPINASGQILTGVRGRPYDGVDLAQTGRGVAVNFGASLFWGGLFALSTAGRGTTAFGMVRRAVGTSLLAGLVDYGLMPRELRPGWERALPPQWVALGLAAMGAGLAAGGLLARQGRPAPR